MMKYITGIHALNIPCSLNTCGDWHSTSIQWEHPNILESSQSIFGDYGIEKNKQINYLNSETNYNVANHIRALLDLMYQNKLSIVQGIRDDYICNDEYTIEIFRKVILMKHCKNWDAIDKLMADEYKMQWINFKRGEFYD